MTKSELREQFLARRKALSAEDVAKRSEQIANTFFEFLDQSPHLHADGTLIHTFLPIVRMNEVNTWPIIQKLWQAFPTVRVATSITDTTTNQLSHYLLTAATPLVENRWGISEPTLVAQSVMATNVDVVLVPLLIFDQTGHRVGYGKGYYDRFLSECRPDCLKIGLSLFESVELIPNIEPTDISLNVCITAERICTF